MAHFRRKRPKKYTLNDCGVKHCRYDHQRGYTKNGKERYVLSQWKQFPFEGKNAWRYRDSYMGG